MLAPGFHDPVLDAQSTFRAVMNAAARPGTIQRLLPATGAPTPLSTGAAAVVLALCDYETPVWLDRDLAQADEVGRWVTFHTGAPITMNMREAAFAFVSDPLLMPDLSEFALGTQDYPDRSSTVVIQVESMPGAKMLRLSGPGIAGAHLFSATPLPESFVAQLGTNRDLFPRGIDCLFVTETEIASIPRSTRVTVEE